MIIRGCRKAVTAAVLVSGALLAGCSGGMSRPDMEDNTGNMGRENPANSGAGEVYAQLAVAYLRNGQTAIALQQAKKSLEVEPGNASGHNIIAVIYTRLREYKLAEHHFLEGLDAQPKNSYLRNAYGTFLCDRQRYKEAGEQFRLALENPLNQSPEVALTNAGICERLSGDQTKAEEYLAQALRANPIFPMALLEMAEIKLRKEEYLSARAYLQRYLEVANHTPASLWIGIRTERMLGDQDAVASYALNLRNNFPDSRENLLLIESENK